jgi:hypothetical protein
VSEHEQEGSPENRMISDLAIRYLSSANQDRVVRFLPLAFIFVCVFDPADKMLRAKMPLFVALWAVTLQRMLERKEIGFLVKPAGRSQWHISCTW